MRIAIVGCGYVADYYLKTLPLHPELQVVGVTDRDASRRDRFARFHGLPTYASLDELLADPAVELVLNLTNPASHHSVTRSSLEAGKHVYSEKPLASEFADAQALVDLAESRGLGLASAPCSLLNETAQTLAKALREDRIGRVRLAYAEMDDGLVHRMPYRRWVSESGTPWPYKNEFESGCTLEHAGYSLTWLAAFFGPARSVTAFSSCLIPDKETDVPLEAEAPDFSVACIRYESGVVARLTCSIVAPRDHSLRIFGDAGTLGTDDVWNDRSPVYLSRSVNLGRRRVALPWRKKLPLVGRRNPQVKYRGAQQRNFARGVAELAESVREGRPCRLSARYCLHITELVLAIQGALDTGAPHKLTTSFEPIDPMPYAQS